MFDIGAANYSFSKGFGSSLFKDFSMGTHGNGKQWRKINKLKSYEIEIKV